MNAPTPTFEQCSTAVQVFRLRAQQWAERPALRHKRRGLWETIAWKDYYAQARAVGLALQAMGMQRGEVSSILSENRPQWLVADLGAQCMGFVGNGVYPTASEAQLAYILQHSRSRVLFVENQEQLEKVLAVRDQCPDLLRIVVFEREGLRGLRDGAVMFFDELLQQGMALSDAAGCARFEASMDAAQPGDTAFLVYTSGTTGAPKGAMISHRNLVFQMTQAPHYLDAQPGDHSLSFLPLCHIAERMASTFNAMAIGLVVHFPENAGTVVNDMREVQPHVVFAPPRYWEKLYSQVNLFMRDAIAPARMVYQHALDRNRHAVRQRLQLEAGSDAREIPGWLARLAFGNIRTFLGLQRVKTALTGAAPVPPDLVQWFLSIGVELREAFGMTETCGFCTATPTGAVRLGWAGVPGVGIEVRLGESSEVLVRGANVFAGYWQDPERTREAVDADGWLHTGDCGEINAEGYLAIRDRIKDILITSGGKNITPSQIENLLKFSPYITDAVVVGEGRNYLTALIMIDQEHVARHAQEQQIPYTDFASLTRHADVLALIGQQVEQANGKLSRVEQIKSFRIIDQLLTAEDEELTPTMKLKRRVIATKYAALIEGMYGSH